MNVNLLAPFQTIPYFTIEGFKQISGIENPEYARIHLHRWAKAGHVLPLKRGVYMTRRFYEQHSADYLFSPAVSAILMPKSYVSLEFILQQNNILTEVTYPITCVTTKNTRKIVNDIGTFWYRHLRDDLYHGFTISEYHGISVAQATLPKALFDYLYLRPISVTYRRLKIDLAGELRLNLEEFSNTDRLEFARLVEASSSLKMKDILLNFRRHIWQL